WAGGVKSELPLAAVQDEGGNRGRVATGADVALADRRDRLEIRGAGDRGRRTADGGEALPPVRRTADDRTDLRAGQLVLQPAQLRLVTPIPLSHARRLAVPRRAAMFSACASRSRRSVAGRR